MKGTPPLISVVLPVYNCGPYIEECLKSILDQTIQDFEIIVIDDCSSDDTIKKLKSFNDNRIQVHCKVENKGLIDSLNMGFALASGRYIARVDGDDINTLDRFEKQLKILQNNNRIKACGCWLQCFGASENIIKHPQAHSEIQAHLLLSNPMSLGATMLEREAFKDVTFDPDKKHAEDYDFWARTAWDVEFYNIQEPLYFYRIHTQQVSSQHKEIQLAVDAAIKLPLFEKLGYDEAVYPNDLIQKVLYSKLKVSVVEVVLIQEWFSQLKRENMELRVYSISTLDKVLKKIERQLLNQLYYTNDREGVDYAFRKQLVRHLPFSFKRELLVVKLKERFKLNIRGNREL